MSSERIAKVNSVVVSLVGEALRRNFDEPGVLATISKAETTPDLRETTVWISVLPDSDEGWSKIEELRGELQQALAAGLETKHTPRLRLQQDHGPADTARINELLRDA